MSQAAVKEARKPENQGRLPPGWQAGYFDDHGFAPIVNPGSGEMQQPDGGAPGRASPAAESAQAPAIKEPTATGPGGHKLVLRNGQWVPQ
jgi:hypothetical protein